MVEAIGSAIEKLTPKLENSLITYLTLSVIYLRKLWTLAGSFIIALRSLSVLSIKPAKVIGPDTEQPTPQIPFPASTSLDVAL